MQAVSTISQVYTSPKAVSFGCASSSSASQAARFGQDAYTPQNPKRPGHIIDEAATPQNYLQRIGEKMIRWYQNNEMIDQFYAKINLHCMYADTGSTSCSQYTLDKIRTEGFIKGCFKGLGRILNCNPFSMKSEKMQGYFRDDVLRAVSQPNVISGRRYTPSFMTQ